MSGEPPWWAPFSSPAEFHHHQQERQRLPPEAHERWWASLSNEQRSEVLRAEEEQAIAVRRRDEQERHRSREAERLVAERLQQAQASIGRSLQLLAGTGAPGTLDVRDENQQGASLWPRRIGRGWPVGALSIHHLGSGSSGRSAGQESSTSKFDVLISTAGAWLLVRQPQSRPVFIRGRRYGTVLLSEGESIEALDRNPGRLADDFRAALPSYAHELQAIAARLVGNSAKPEGESP